MQRPNSEFRSALFCTWVGVSLAALGCSSSNSAGNGGNGVADGTGGVSASSGGNAGTAGASKSEAGGSLASGATGGSKSASGGSTGPETSNPTGGATDLGGQSSSGGAPNTGGAPTGGRSSTGGGPAAGGALATGGKTSNGGVPGTGGATGTGGAPATGGKSGALGGSSSATGGAQATGGASNAIGGSATGGKSAAAGATATGGSVSTSTLPGDVAMAAGTPFVAAHSMTRAMFASYSGPLFKALRVSDNQEKDINAVAAGGLGDFAALNTFCSGTTCKVTTLYDQSGNANDMWRGDTTANAPGTPKLCDLMDIEYWQMSDGTKVPIALEHGWESNLVWKSVAQCLRNRDKTKNMPKGATPETQYGIFHAKYVNNNCCFNYGNTGNAIHYTGAGTLSALNFSKITFWSKGTGTGPWPMVDWEQGVYAGNTGLCGSGIPTGTTCTTTGQNPNPTVSFNIVTALMKHNGINHWALKSGNAQSGALSVNIDLSSLPTGGYSPLKQEGGLGLGEGGAGDSGGSGGFSEGAVMAAETTDATDNAIQTSIVSVFSK